MEHEHHHHHHEEEEEHGRLVRKAYFLGVYTSQANNVTTGRIYNTAEKSALSQVCLEHAGPGTKMAVFVPGPYYSSRTGNTYNRERI